MRTASPLICALILSMAAHASATGLVKQMTREDRSQLRANSEKHHLYNNVARLQTLAGGKSGSSAEATEQHVDAMRTLLDVRPSKGFGMTFAKQVVAKVGARDAKRMAHAMVVLAKRAETVSAGHLQGDTPSELRPKLEAAHADDVIDRQVAETHLSLVEKLTK